MLYLLHFTQPLGDVTRPHMSARHYLGFCDDTIDALLNRVQEHRTGQGSAITKAAISAGADLVLSWVDTGTRSDERRLKKAGNHQRRCLMCQLRSRT